MLVKHITSLVGNTRHNLSNFLNNFGLTRRSIVTNQEDDKSGNEELDDDEEADTGADVAGLAVHAGHDVDDALTEGDDHAEH